MNELELKLTGVKEALKVLEQHKSDLIDLRDRLTIEDFKAKTGLFIGKKVTLHGNEMEVVDFEMLAWPIAVCKAERDGQLYTYKLTNWDLKSMGVTPYSDDLKIDIKVPKPDLNVIMDEFEKTLGSESVTYRSEKDIAKAILKIIDLKF